ncbi:DNA-binding phage protein [Leucobacter exalbidus]|uniref:DNA-binding phage protein n=2 Tax=Leucobacter exalbidus TaxID=662960 RepID=A0A940T2B9_9MICO|nr:DNA-binding phage protein [Leucobacter exalbidus]
MSAAELARRAHVTRDTLRAIEHGTGSPKIESLMSVITALGFADHFVSGTDPFKTDSGRALALEVIGKK